MRVGYFYIHGHLSRCNHGSVDRFTTRVFAIGNLVVITIWWYVAFFRAAQSMLESIIFREAGSAVKKKQPGELNEPFGKLKQFGRRFEKSPRRSAREQAVALDLRRTAVGRVPHNTRPGWSEVQDLHARFQACVHRNGHRLADLRFWFVEPLTICYLLYVFHNDFFKRL